MKKYYTKALLLILVFLFLLTGCGPEKPPVYYYPPANQPADNTQPVSELSDYEGNSKPLDYSPCEGIHVSAEANAFWNDTVVEFKPLTEDSENIRNINNMLYENAGVLIFSAFEVDAGLKDDEIIPGQYDVQYDLKTLNVDPSVYEYLKVYRVADDGSYYELNSELEGNVLSFSCNQNSIIVVGGSIFLAGLGIKAMSDEYNERNLYYIGSGRDVLVHEGNNTYGKWQIEWLSSDLDPDLAKKLKRMVQIEYGYKKEAEKYYSDDIYAANNVMYLNRQIFDYTVRKIEADEEHKKMREQIALPDPIRKIDEYIGNAFRYLYQEEKMRMPLHRVPFKLIHDNKKDYLGLANNRLLSSSYIDINLNKLNFQSKNDMYNLQLTLTHELLHICQIRYRLPIDAISDNTRYDEMVAQYMEADALAYYVFKDIIPEGENIDLTRTDYWGNLRLPINGEEDNNIEDKETRQDEVINCGYNLGSFLRYLKNKTGRKVTCHQIMKGRDYLTSGKLSKSLCEVFEIDEREFDIHFRNWVISNRKEIGEMAYGFVTAGMYGLKPPIITKKGEKYHIDLIHGNSYFLNMTCFEPANNEKQIMILSVDKELNEVFPSANVGTGIDRKVITAGHYFDRLSSYANKYRNLAVIEIQGDSSDQDRSKNAGYTVYVLDKTPKVELSLSDDKLLIQLPKPEAVAEDGIADGYIVTLETDNGIKKAKEIKKDLFGKSTDISRDVLYNGDPDKDVNVSVTLNEFFLEENGNRIMGIESDKVTIRVPKKEKTQQKPDGGGTQTDGSDTSQIPKSGGYWKLKETNVRKAEDEPGNEQILTSIYYTASELVHTQKTTVPKTNYHGSGYANQTAVCSKAPKIIIPGEKVIMRVQLSDEHGGDCGLRVIRGSVSYGKPDDNRTDIAYNRGVKFAATKEGAENSAYLDTIGNTPCPEVEVYHEFDKGYKDGEEIAILFHGASSSTLWIYEWVSQQ